MQSNATYAEKNHLQRFFQLFQFELRQLFEFQERERFQFQERQLRQQLQALAGRRGEFGEFENKEYLQMCFDLFFPFIQTMPLQAHASCQYQIIWIGLIIVAIADFCLFAPEISNFHESFKSALDFCLNAPSYLKLMSTMENMFLNLKYKKTQNGTLKYVKAAILNALTTSFINDANIVTNMVLDSIKENRGNSENYN